jgi:hypothetical protein
MEKFYVWLMPEARKVLGEDRGNLPLFAMNLSKWYQEIVNDLGGNKTFDNWDDAYNYGKEIAETMCWYFDIDNEAGRQAAFEIENGFIK